MQPDFSIRQNLRNGGANACHQFAVNIDLVVAHVDLAIGIDETDQVALNDFPTGIFSGENVARLLIMKLRFAACLAIGCVGNRAEDFVVVMDHFEIGFEENYNAMAGFTSPQSIAPRPA